MKWILGSLCRFGKHGARNNLDPTSGAPAYGLRSRSCRVKDGICSLVTSCTQREAFYSVFEKSKQVNFS